jgi:hypothetical protein
VCVCGVPACRHLATAGGTSPQLASPRGPLYESNFVCMRTCVPAVIRVRARACERVCCENGEHVHLRACTNVYLRPCVCVWPSEKKDIVPPLIIPSFSPPRHSPSPLDHRGKRATQLNIHRPRTDPITEDVTTTPRGVGGDNYEPLFKRKGVSVKLQVVFLEAPITLIA